MMADRAHIVRNAREQKRREIMFIEVDPRSPEENERECLICQDEMGVEDAEASMRVILK